MTHVDGERGQLLYRGYPIEQLAARSDMLDCIFLLLHGELPDATERAAYRSLLRSHRMVHTGLVEFYRGFKSDAPPMAIMVAVVGALSSFYPVRVSLAHLDSLAHFSPLQDATEVSDPARRELACVRVISKLPVIAALAFKTSIGQPVVYPRDDLDYAENLLYMMFSVPTRPYVVDDFSARALEVILMLHLDHEQNASTSTVRIAGSSQANPYACVASGIASLWGPAHGGANEAVVAMLEAIGTVDRIPAFIAKAKDKHDPFRLMGFGHRIYKVRDPRAAVMADLCHNLLAHLGSGEEPLLKLALELEGVALADPYFVARRLYPNVDFYSGLCLRALGIPTSMFTPIFAVARGSGWVSQWREMASEGSSRISRPRQMYQGIMWRDYVDAPARPPSGVGGAAARVPMDPADAVAHIPHRLLWKAGEQVVVNASVQAQC